MTDLLPLPEPSQVEVVIPCNGGKITAFTLPVYHADQMRSYALANMAVLQRDIDNAFAMLQFYGVPRERAKSISNGIDVLATRMTRESVALQARVAELEADARRYRFLRNFVRPLDFYSMEPNWEVSRAQHGMGHIYRGEQLDREVDAALAGTQGEKK